MELHLAHGVIDEHRLILGNLQRHPLRFEFLGELLHLRLDCIGDSDGVCAGLAAHQQRNGARAVEPRQAAFLLKSIFHAANVAHAHRRALTIRDHHVGDFLSRLEFGLGANHILGRAGFHTAPRLLNMFRL